MPRFWAGQFFIGSLIAKNPTWKNLRDVKKTIDYMFISLNLVNAVVGHNVVDISKYFNTDHQTVFLSVSLDGLLDTQLNSICRQANKDQLKFDFKSAKDTK
ncbi:hypothetical protein G9A89_021145 [Geosiphon pyriformis]|nr:hypothetical protein G9A89_021145 [Geosiphon pyriformis]